MLSVAARAGKVDQLTSFANWSICSGLSPVYANMPILQGQYCYTSGCSSSHGYSTNLRGDVAPVMLAAQVFQVLFQERSHFDDTLSHSLHFSEPLLVEVRAVQYLCSDASTVDRRIGV